MQKGRCNVKTLKSFGLVAILAFGFLVPSVVCGGANTWTGGRPMGVPDAEAGGKLATDPSNPSVVYGAFGQTLYRSVDGGRTWRSIQTFDGIRALLIHPAAPSTIYVAASDRVFKSTDSGATWTTTLLDHVTALAGSPTDPATVFAGSFWRMRKTVDSGATWTSTTVVSTVSSLVIDPRDERVAYAGGEGYSWFAEYPGGLSKTTDGGESWSNAGPNRDHVRAVGVDPVGGSTVYIATGPYTQEEILTLPDVLRSDDGGGSWTSVVHGLPEGDIRSLAVDPAVSGTVYAGTQAGVYRSRDGGRSWHPFAQRLAGATVTNLAITDSGRTLHATTPNGPFAFEIARGPIDVAVGPGGESRVLVWDADRLSIGAVGSSGAWSSGVPSAASSTWTAVALAESGSRSRVLWQCGDGRSALEIVGPAGRESVNVFASSPEWIPSDVSVRADGKTHVLWTGTDGRMFVARVSASGAVQKGPTYGPAPGWSAIAIADGPGTDTWVLWRATDGRWAVTPHRDGVMVGAYIHVVDADWSVEDLAVGVDGRPRLLRTQPDGTASVTTIDSDGRLVFERFHERPNLRPRRIASGADGLTRLLFTGSDGNGELLVLDSANSQSAIHALSSARQP
jgi:hypothetical protein